MNELFRKYPAVSVLLLFFVASIPLMILRDWSPSNELRYLSIADEALAEGRFFTFSNHGVPYADKPPLFFWLIMLCRIVAGTHCRLLLESLLCYLPASVTVIVMDRWLCDAVPGIMDTRRRCGTATLILTSILFMGSALVLRMDMLMTMFIILAFSSFHKMYRADFEGGECRNFESWMMPLWIFLALFTKGPVGLLMPVAGIAAFLIVEGRARMICRYLGLRTWGMLAVLGALWLTGAYCEGGIEYLRDLLVHQTVDRAVAAFDHREPFWFYVIYIWVVLLPFSPLVIWGWVHSFRMRYGRSSSERLMAVASLVTFLMLSAFSSKLFIYLLPLCPMLCAVLPCVHVRAGRKWDWSRPVFIYAGILAVGLAAAAPFMKSVNARSSYGEFCKLIPEEAVVSTLFVKRAENIDVYLGRQVTAYYDENDFMEHWGGGVLAVKVSELERKGSRELVSLLESIPYNDCGAFRVYYEQETLLRH